LFNSKLNDRILGFNTPLKRFQSRDVITRIVYVVSFYLQRTESFIIFQIKLITVITTTCTPNSVSDEIRRLLCNVTLKY